MSELKYGLKVFQTAIAFSSLAFMGLVFFSEGFLHRAVLYQEPNLFIAKLEFTLIILGTIATLRQFFESVPRRALE